MVFYIGVITWGLSTGKLLQIHTDTRLINSNKAPIKFLKVLLYDDAITENDTQIEEYLSLQQEITTQKTYRHTNLTYIVLNNVFTRSNGFMSYVSRFNDHALRRAIMKVNVADKKVSFTLEGRQVIIKQCDLNNINVNRYYAN